MRTLLPNLTLAAAAGLVALAACAHAPQSAPVEPAAVWPEPPASPRVKLGLIVDSPEGRRPKVGVWRRIARAIVGVDPESAQTNEFQRPFGLGSSQDGEIVITDPDAALVVRMRPREASSRVRCRNHEWSSPMAAALGEHGTVYVADAGAGAVARVNPRGRCEWLGKGVLERPTSLAIHAGKLYVADPPQHTIVVLSPSGEVIARIGEHGEGDGKLNFPTGVTFNREGELLVVDALNFRIARFTADGKWVGSFGSTLASGGQFAMPKAIAIDDGGRIYVSDAQRDVVLVFLPDGTLDYAMGAAGEAPGSFTNPAGVAAANGQVYVADSFGRRVEAFEILGAEP